MAEQWRDLAGFSAYQVFDLGLNAVTLQLADR